MEIDGLADVVKLTARDVERLSVLVDPAPLVVHAAAGAVAPDDLALVLRRIPTVTVLVGRADAAAAAFDACLVDRAAAATDPKPPAPFVIGDVSEIELAVNEHPLAALALVALLRTTEDADVWAALAAESATYAALIGGDDHRRWLHGRRITTDDGPAVRVLRDGALLTITLDRPRLHNAFNRVMRDELVEALELVADDDSITAVVLDGSGASFCSGGDLGEFGTVDDPPTAHAVRLTRHPGWWIHVSRARIVARVHGACVGAGAELPAFAGRIEAAADAVFSLPELAMGLIPGAGGTVGITRRIGRQRLAWMALTGRRIDAATALEWGLVDQVGASDR